MPKHADNYVASKIAHLRRIGLVSSTSSGTGQNGGACPDWLASAQKEAAQK